METRRSGGVDDKDPDSNPVRGNQSLVAKVTRLFDFRQIYNFLYGNY